MAKLNVEEQTKGLYITIDVDMSDIDTLQEKLEKINEYLDEILEKEARLAAMPLPGSQWGSF